MELSVVTVNFGSSSLLGVCMGSLASSVTRLRAEVLVYDNGPEDACLAKVLEEIPRARVVAGDRGVPFGAANNACTAKSSGEYILFLNPDTVAEPGAVGTLLRFMKSEPRCGAVGARLTSGDGTVEVSCAPDPGIASEALVSLLKRLPPGVRSGLWRSRRPKRVDWVSAAALLVRREAFEQVKGFDEEFPLYFEDADLCRRMRLAGWRVWYCPLSTILHHRGRAGGARAVSSACGSLTASEVSYRKGQILYYAKHRGWLQRRMLDAHLRLRFRRHPGMAEALFRS